MTHTANDPIDDQALNKRQVAKHLLISQRHLENLMRSRSIEFFRAGTAVRFTREAVQRFRESRTVKAVA